MERGSLKTTPAVFLYTPQTVAKMTGLWTSLGAVVGAQVLQIAGVPVKGQIGATERT